MWGPGPGNATGRKSRRRGLTPPQRPKNRGTDPWSIDAYTPMGHKANVPNRPVSVVELAGFRRRADELLTPAERDALVDLVAYEPTGGDIIPGTGGAQKNPGCPPGDGQARRREVIYFFHDPGMPVLLLAIYAKNEKADLAPAERSEFAEFVKAFAAQWRKRK